MAIKPRITISLVTHNGAHYMPFILASIAKQTNKSWQLIILDNNSSDDTVGAIHEEALPYKLVEQRHNIGFARGHNAIFNWSDSEYILVLNQDVVLAEDYLEKLAAFMDLHPEVGAVSGLLLRWDFANSQLTDSIDSAGLESDRRYHFRERLQGEEKSAATSEQVFGLSATAVLYRRAALEAVKIPKIQNHELFEYFDEDFFAYKEDVDLAWRLRLSGWENYLLATAYAYHDRTLSAHNSRRQQRSSRSILNKLSYRNHLLMLRKNTFSSISWRNCLFWLPYEWGKFAYLLFLDRSSLSGWREYLGLKSRMNYKRRYIHKIQTMKAKDMGHWFSKSVAIHKT